MLNIGSYNANLCTITDSADVYKFFHLLVIDNFQFYAE